jgi:hypothetical protein
MSSQTTTITVRLTPQEVARVDELRGDGGAARRSCGSCCTGPIDDAPTYAEALALLARLARAGKTPAQVALERALRRPVSTRRTRPRLAVERGTGAERRDEDGGARPNPGEGASPRGPRAARGTPRRRRRARAAPGRGGAMDPSRPNHPLSALCGRAGGRRGLTPTGRRGAVPLPRALAATLRQARRRESAPA